MTRFLLPACLVLLSATLGAPIQPAHAAYPAASMLPRCQTAQLRGSLGAQNGGAGSIFTPIVLRNVSRSTCTLFGHPGVSLLNRQYRQIGRSARWDPGTMGLIVLRPGNAASTTVRSLNPGVGTTDCLPPSTALRLYPPDQRASLIIPARLSECLGTLSVKPLVPGTAGL